MYLLFAAKVAKQIVDYFTMALTTLEQGRVEDGTISDVVGSKIYKVIKLYFIHLNYTFL